MVAVHPVQCLFLKGKSESICNTDFSCDKDFHQLYLSDGDKSSEESPTERFWRKGGEGTAQRLSSAGETVELAILIAHTGIFFS